VKFPQQVVTVRLQPQQPSQSTHLLSTGLLYWRINAAVLAYAVGLASRAAAEAVWTARCWLAA